MAGGVPAGYSGGLDRRLLGGGGRKMRREMTTAFDAKKIRSPVFWNLEDKRATAFASTSSPTGVLHCLGLREGDVKEINLDSSEAAGFRTVGSQLLWHVPPRGDMFWRWR